MSEYDEKARQVIEQITTDPHLPYAHVLARLREEWREGVTLYISKAIEEAVAAETERCVKFVWERGDVLHELSGRGHLVNDAKFTAGRELIAAAQALRARKP